MTRVCLIIGLLLLPGYSWTAAPANLYAGQDTRDIKALSQQEVEAYLAGRGLGLAKAAELNHYPGPVHVLELAEQLNLSSDQRQKTRALFDRMLSKAVPLGTQLVEKERQLDALFASGNISPANLERVVGEIAALHGQLRAAHLRAHLEQKKILTAEQVRRYDDLRGYSAPNAAESSHHGARH